MSAPFAVEANWPTQSLKELCSGDGASIQTGPFGTQLHAADYVTDGIPCVMPQDIRQGVISVENIARITPEDHARLSRFKLREGDIIYPRRGDISKRALVGRREAGWLCGTGCLRIRPNTAKVDPQYLAYFLSHPEVCGWLEGNAVGATMPHLNTGLIGSVSTVCPPLSEQREIASTLGALDDKIELNRKTAATLEEMARALYRSWFVDFDPVRARAEGRSPAHMDAATAALFPDSFGEDGLPAGWTTQKLGQLITRLKVGKLYDQKSISDVGLVPVFDQGRSGIIGFHNNEPNFRASAEDRISLFANHTCVQRLVDFDFSTIQNVIPFKGRELPTEWCHYASLGLQNFEEYRGHWPSFVENEVVRPRVEIALAFKSEVEIWLRLISLKNAERVSLTKLRDTLLPRLMSGELRVGAARKLIEEVA